MADLRSFYSALQLSDSAFPSGRYTLSYGLEGFVQNGELGARHSDALTALVSDSIRLSAAPSDGVALACAHRAFDCEDNSIDVDLVTRADERLTAVKLVREVRQASARTGRALLASAEAAFDTAALRPYAELVSAGGAPGNHAVVLGLVSASLSVPPPEAVAGELYAVAAGWAGAAVRLGLLDHRSSQRLLNRLRPVVAEAALRAVERDVEEISSSALLSDVMSMRHEQADLRLFAT
jgi:urease accessory protein